MPTRIVVQLRAEHGMATTAPPVGPAPNAHLLAAIGHHVSEQRASELHNARSPKPYRITPLLDEAGGVAAPGARASSYAVCFFRDELATGVADALRQAERFAVGRASYRIVRVTSEPPRSYRELLGNAERVLCWRYNFLSAFSLQTPIEAGPRRQRVFPEPELTYGHLLQRWRDFAPDVPLPGDAEIAVGWHLQVTQHEIKTARHLVHTPGANAAGAARPSAWRLGSIGSISYEFVESSRLPADTAIGLDALGLFAEYAGVGDRTVMGMGHVRVERFRSSGVASQPVAAVAPETAAGSEQPVAGPHGPPSSRRLEERKRTFGQ